MIVKTLGNHSRDIRKLETQLAQAGSNARKAERLRSLIAFIKAGQKAEEEVQYHLDFAFGREDGFALIHDLRLVVAGRTAQIDHLVVHETGTIFVVETKSVRTRIKITENGEFLRYDKTTDRYKGMPSPLRQNDRHAAVLQDLLAQLSPGPTHRIEPLVAVSSEGVVERPESMDTTRLVKADMLADRIRSLLPPAGARQFATPEALRRFAEGLAAHHRPARGNEATQFGMPNKPIVGEVRRKAPQAVLKEETNEEEAPGHPPLWKSILVGLIEPMADMLRLLWGILPAGTRRLLKIAFAVIAIGVAGNWIAGALNADQAPSHQPVAARQIPKLKPEAPPPASPAMQPTSRRADPQKNASIADSLREAEVCHAAKRYDCAIGIAGAVLRMDPGNRQAGEIKQRSEEALRAAMNSITLE